MAEKIFAGLFWLMILFPFAVFFLQLRKIRHGLVSRSKATVLFFLISLIPAATLITLFLGLVGMETLTGQALIGETHARALLPVTIVYFLVIAVLTLIFGIAAALLARPKVPHE